MKKIFIIHEGYFHGELSKNLIYKLAFTGFKEVLISLEKELESQPDFNEMQTNITSQLSPQAIKDSLMSQGLESDRQESPKEMIRLSRVFSELCKSKGIQVFLAPERYRVDILGKQRDRRGY
jgi:hypothetical protein